MHVLGWLPAAASRKTCLAVCPTLQAQAAGGLLLGGRRALCVGWLLRERWPRERGELLPLDRSRMRRLWNAAVGWWRELVGRRAGGTAERRSHLVCALGLGGWGFALHGMPIAH